MTRTRIFRALAASAAVGVISVGLVVPALAQDDADDTTVTDVREERRAEFAAALAEELGLDEETVATAIDTVRDELRAALRAAHQAERLALLGERLADAVEGGALTQEQADAILEAHEQGVFPRGGIRGWGGGRHGRGGPAFGAGPGTGSVAGFGSSADA